MIPSAELLAQWAAEELWDWRVRVMFASLCAAAALFALFVYLAWGRSQNGQSDGRARRYTGRISVSLIVIAVAEASFFKEPVSTALLLATALALGAIALGMPPKAESPDPETPASPTNC